MLSLTEEGRALYEKVLADAIARNERLLSPLSAPQREQLMAMLSAVTVSARKVLEDEQRAASGEAIDDEEPARASRTTRKTGAADEANLGEIRDLVSRLQQLVGGV
jgi:DNA-binding MarR family transcriptional regulator